MLDPEHTKSHEIGLNAGFLNDKISLAFTMYKTSTSDLPFGGYLSIPFQGDIYFMYNGAKVDNKGFELILSTNMNIGQVKWDGRFTYSINKNEVKQLLEPQKNPITGTDFNLKEIQMGKGIGWYTPLKEGGSIGDIYITDFREMHRGMLLLINPHRLSILHTTMCMQVILILNIRWAWLTVFYGKALNSIL